MRFRNLKAYSYIFLLFSADWIFLYYRFISLVKKVDSLDILLTYFASCGQGFLSCRNVGIAATAVFAVGILKASKNVNTCVAVRMKKDEFAKLEIKEQIFESTLFSACYMAVAVAFCTVFCDIKMLFSCNYYLCMLLYFIILDLYFSIVGTAYLCIRNILNFNSLSLLITIVLFGGLFAVYESTGKTVTPIACVVFMGNWFANGVFNAAQYFIQVLVLIGVLALLSFISRLIFSKRDIL